MSGRSAIVRSVRWLARTSACNAGLSSPIWLGSTAIPTVGIWKWSPTHASRWNPSSSATCSGDKRAADVGGVDGSVAEASQIHLIVARGPRQALHIAVGVKAMLAQDDPGETAGSGVAAWTARRRPRRSAMDFTSATAEKPEQRSMGIDAEHRPTDAVGEPRQQGPAEADRRTAAHTVCLPLDSVANGDVDAFILVVALLIGDIGDQFLVIPVPDIGQVDSVHGWNPSCWTVLTFMRTAHR